MIDLPQIVRMTAQTTAVIRLTVPREDIRNVMGPGHRELMDAVAALASAWGEFIGWIAAEGHAPAADLWEVYVAGPESGSDPTTWRTELNRPLAR